MSDETAVYPYGMDVEGGCTRCGIKEENSVTHACPPGFDLYPGIKHEPVTIYAIADINGGAIIDKMPNAVFLHSDEDLWDDNDYDGLTGLVVWEGEHLKRPENAQVEDEEAPGYWEYGEYDDFYLGEWRQGTAEDAKACGLLQ